MRPRHWNYDVEVIFDVKLAVSIGLHVMASNIIVAHNHPGQSLKPSKDDIAITKSLNTACHYFGIDLVDHLVVTPKGYYSFREHRMLN